VNDLDQLWKDGFFMARTVRHPRGRSVRAALALLVCDLPAARLMGGFAHYCSNADACSMCKTSNINDLDPQTFVPRTNEEHRQGALAWLAAQSEEERDVLYRRNGVRWSELLRLEYFDPIKNTVIDPMHGFYLRIFQRHCRQIWGMSVDLVDCDGLWEIELPTEEGKVLARDVYDHGSAANLRALKVDSLRYLAIQEGLDYRRSRRALADSLLQMVPLLSGQPKAYFKKLSSDTIGRLAKILGVQAFTPAGAPSRAKHLLVDKLFEWVCMFSFLKVNRRPSRLLIVEGLIRKSQAKQIALNLTFYRIPLLRLRYAFYSCNCQYCSRARKRFRITDEDGQLLNKAANKKSAVLGKSTLAAIREDMEGLHLPSWMAAAPSRPGEASQGKFSADQWRTFCTVNLPVTLIRLWGSHPPEDRRHKMLVNFMHLVTSVRLADMRATTEEQIQSYEHHYRTYVTTLVGFGNKENIGGLYPHTRITPYQHMMLHFGDLLRRFGPVHSWRCFPFERFNYILQTTKTNSRFGVSSFVLISPTC
ncbi:hypothetical protein C8R42DRAFT_554482, partial [Lentinula raphanica]